MQDTGKRLLIAVALALGVMFLWNQIFPPKKEPPKAVATQTAGSGSGSASGSAAGTTTTAAGTTVPEAVVQRGVEQRIVLGYKRFTATFSSYGGNLVSYKLADHRYERDQTKGELLPVEADTGAFGVNFARSTYVLPKKQEWVGEKLTDTSVRYTLKTPELELTKVYMIDPDHYLVHMKVTAKVIAPGATEAIENLAISAFAFQDPKKIQKGTSQEGPRAWFSSTMRGGSIFHTGVENVTKAPREELGVTWSGFEHPYLLAAYAPKTDVTSPVNKRTYIDGTPGTMRMDLLFGEKRVKSGETLEREVTAYLGPKNYTALGKADEFAGFTTGFKATIDLGWFSFIGKPLLWLLLKFYMVLGNWGLAIILLTFLVKGATLYWTTKSMRSMKAMAALAPQMKGLQEKYKEDRQRLQAETMALYKTHEVSPIAGCLPIVLQMPIWLALYRMLSTAGELYQQPFIHGWIDDLTATDPFHILPIVLVITMFAQARLTPVTGDSRQQKIMQYGMPIGFGVMSFMFPAGLTLYIFTNTCLSALHSIYMNKFDKKSLAIVARMKKAAEETAAKEAAVTGQKKKTPAKKVIDAKSIEASDDDDDDVEAPDTGGSAASNPARQNRPKKKRRRK